MHSLTTVVPEYPLSIGRTPSIGHAAGLPRPEDKAHRFG